MSRTVESAEVSWDVTEAIRETFEALENAKLIRGSYKVVEADISLHSLQLQQDYNKIIKMEIKRGDSCNPTAIGPLGPIWDKKTPTWWKIAGLDNIEDMQKCPRHVFISYSHENQAIVTQISNLLASSGITCFKSDRDIHPTSYWDESIWDAIRSCKIFVSVLTPEFLKSRWLNLEFGAAKVSKKKILPILHGVTPDKIPHPFDQIQSVVVDNKSQIPELIKLLKSITADIV